MESKLSNSFRPWPASKEYVNTLFISFFSVSKFNFYFSDAPGGELTFGIKFIVEGFWLFKPAPNSFLPNFRKVVGTAC